MKFFINYKRALILLLKLFFSAGIIYWLISEGKLDFNLIIESFKNPLAWVFCFLLTCLQILMGALRWKILLQTKIKHISFLEVARIHWIGKFFSSIIPGTVTGELVKVVYMKKLEKDSTKKFLFFSVFLDRLTGLNALLFLAGITSLIFHKKLSEINPLLDNIMYINLILLVISSSVFAVFFIGRNTQKKILSLISSPKLKVFFETIWSFSSYRKEISKVLLISLFIHLITILIFWIINIPFFETSIKIEHLLGLLPLGQVVAALPISPAGLGVGHAAFERLFHLIGHSNGASLFNIYWIVNMCANLVGVLAFIFSRKKT